MSTRTLQDYLVILRELGARVANINEDDAFEHSNDLVALRQEVAHLLDDVFVHDRNSLREDLKALLHHIRQQGGIELDEDLKRDASELLAMDNDKPVSMLDLIQQVADSLDDNTVAGLSKPHKKCLFDAAAQIKKAIRTSAPKEDSPTPPPAIDAAMTPQETVIYLVGNTADTHKVKLAAALQAARRGVEFANLDCWKTVCRQLAPKWASLIKDVKQLQDTPVDLEQDDVLGKWAQVNKLVFISQSKADGADFATSWLTKILAWRFSKAWTNMEVHSNGSNRFCTKLHERCYMATTHEFDGLALKDAHELLATEKHQNALPSFIRKQQKLMTTQGLLVKVVSQLGFMVMLDPRWSLTSLSGTRTNYVTQASELAQELDNQYQQSGTHPLSDTQEGVVQAWLSMAVIYGGDTLAELVDEFVDDAAPDMSFVPWN